MRFCEVGWLRDLTRCLKILERFVERHSEADVGVLRWMGERDRDEGRKDGRQKGGIPRKLV